MTAPSMSYLDETARHYRDTLAHAVTVGLSVQQAKQVIGEALCRDAALGRTTDWHGVCDRLTAAADRERVATQPPELLPSVTVIVPAGEVTSRG